MEGNEQNKLFYCYSPKLMHFLKASNIYYLYKSYNANSHSTYYVFERNERLSAALKGWDQFKRKQMEDDADV